MLSYFFSFCHRQRCIDWRIGSWIGCFVLLRSWHEQRRINYHEQFNVSVTFTIICDICCQISINNYTIYRVWPQYVRERVHDTYAYFGASVGITAASAAAVFRTPALLNLFARTGWMAMIGTMALMIGSGMVAHSIPYENGIGAKQFAWATHCAIMGAVLAPLSFVGGQILIRAAW